MAGARSALRPLPASQRTKRPSAGAHSITVVLPWDLDPRLGAFPRRPGDGQLLVLESRAKPHALPFHRQKLTMLVSALRHFVAERRAAGFHVEHRVADDYGTGVREFAAWAIDARFRELTSELPVTIHAAPGLARGQTPDAGADPQPGSLRS